MDAQMLKIISYFCFGFAVLFLLIAVILFFRFRVRELIAKLSGKQEAQQIREIRGHIGATKSNAVHYVFDHGVDTDNTTQILEDGMETVLLEDVISNASADLIKIPFAAPRPVPTMIAVGVASPRAHGQEITSTEIATESANSKL